MAIDRIRRPAFDAWATSMQRVRHRSSGQPDSGAPGGACSTTALENITFMEGDFQQLPLQDLLAAAPSLVLCVHGCNEVALHVCAHARVHVCACARIHCACRPSPVWTKVVRGHASMYVAAQGTVHVLCCAVLHIHI